MGLQMLCIALFLWVMRSWLWPESFGRDLARIVRAYRAALEET